MAIVTGVAVLQKRQLDASTCCVQLIVDAESTDLSVEDFLDASGISRRTFHRWFPSKEQVLRPFFADMSQQFAEQLGAAHDLTLDSVTAAWSETVIGGEPSARLRLHRVLRASVEYWSAFLEVLQDGERILAHELRASQKKATEREIVVSAAAIVGSSRLALDAAASHGLEPDREFRAYLRAFDPPVLS